jgi:hypothetical protein
VSRSLPRPPPLLSPHHPPLTCSEAGSKARLPFLKRSVGGQRGGGGSSGRGGGDAPILSDYEPGGAAAAAAGAAAGGRGGAATQPLGGGISMSVGDTGSLDYVDGGEEGLRRRA